VLVISGLIIGGILVRQDLINAAAVRAQIKQIEKYQTAVNTFRLKFNALPDDMNAATATGFGFAARGTYAGQGDGNGVLQANGPGTDTIAYGSKNLCGEEGMFWVDLTYANGGKLHLIEGSFNPGTYAANAWWNCSTMPAVAAAAVGQFMPRAKL